MSREVYDIMKWWEDLEFENKEQYRLDEPGMLVLNPGMYVKERTVGNVSIDNADVVVQQLREKFAHVEAKVRDFEVEWLAAEDKLKLADKLAHLKDFLNSVNAIGDFAKMNALVHTWEHTIFTLSEDNYNAKLKMVEQAESLATSEQWKDATQALRDIADKWKLTGHVDKSRSEKLWTRFEAARKTFYERKRVHQEEEEKDMLHNLDLKLEIVSQAETLAASTEWKATSDTFHKLTDEWKSIGYTHNKKNEELWQRFMAAKSVFFEKKREHSQMVQQEQDANYIKKMALAEKAEAIKESHEWSATTQVMAGLGEEWRKTGRVPQEKADELKKRFFEAQEYFFDAKRKHSDQIKTEQENNYLQKKALLDRAEIIKDSNYWSEVTTELGDLLTEWKKIGPIPRAYGDKLWEDFNAARKHFFARKDASREQRKQYAETQKAVRIENAKASVQRLQADIREEEEKLADFRLSITNITPGKKAAELKAHLEKLIIETERNIRKMKERFDAALAGDDEKPGNRRAGHMKEA